MYKQIKNTSVFERERKMNISKYHFSNFDTHILKNILRDFQQFSLFNIFEGNMTAYMS